MLIETMTLMLAAASQDASVLQLPPPPLFKESIPWTGPRNPRTEPRDPNSARVLRVDRIVSCSRPAQGALVSWEELPAEVLADLRRTDPQMSPPGGLFSPTDVWDGTSPFTRMIAAMRRGDRLAVAYERGGRGYSVVVLTYVRSSSRALFAIKGLNPVDPRALSQSEPEPADAACAALESALER